MGDFGLDVKIRRSWPWWLRVTVALVLTLLLWWPYAGWHWHERVAQGPGLRVVSPKTSRVVRCESAYTLLAKAVTYPFGIRTSKAMWKLGHVIALSMPAALVSILMYCILSSVTDRRKLEGRESQCRRCGHILRGLTLPRCTECGEPI